MRVIPDKIFAIVIDGKKGFYVARAVGDARTGALYFERLADGGMALAQVSGGRLPSEVRAALSADGIIVA